VSFSCREGEGGTFLGGSFSYGEVHLECALEMVQLEGATRRLRARGRSVMGRYI